MPCSGGGPSREDQEREARDQDTLARLACDRCRELEARGGTVPEWAREWWVDHKKQDAERARREKAAKTSAKIRKQAIAKLSKAERDELGV